LWPDHGAMREQMVYPASHCVPLPDGISHEAAALLEPLGVALHAIRLARIEVGDDVLVTGCGGIGLLIIRLAQLAGAKRIFASDHYAWRLRLAQEYGATDTLQVGAGERGAVVDLVKQITHGRGVDVAIEAAWVKDTGSECVEAIRFGGSVVIVGIPVEEEIAFRASPSRRKGATIKFSRRMNHTYPAAIALADSGQVALDRLASHRFPLAQAAEAFVHAADYIEGVVRVIVMPGASP
ncbi:MAG TPA: zinc-binding dehydrogenase, partial [Aggregatilineales bacterium]|nr:zinc-binding dehydrogenase [Aggregatilineales bacterium]